ncbi:GrpB family protein [Rhizobacter sp. OV335]|uniref:GrpB family protein n=1 Tax=Rhizobacter sp. OV335 TaxID=1500264 RepID=UPI000936E70E|nr:GrpB family protein [Rhizobacter sp. OV335]
MSKRTIEIAPYNPLWATMFEHEQQALENVLGPHARIHHIGSTSVPGLAAKVVIDILVEVPRVEQLDSLTTGFRGLGYEPRGENGIPERRYFVKGSSKRTHQVHAFRTGSHDVRRHLALRDFLRTNSEARDAYAAVKRHAVAECGNDVYAYTTLKIDFARLLEARSLTALDSAQGRRRT